MVALTLVAAVKDQAIILAGMWTSTEKSPIIKYCSVVSLYPGLLPCHRLKLRLLGIRTENFLCLLQKNFTARFSKSFSVRFYSLLQPIRF